MTYIIVGIVAGLLLLCVVLALAVIVCQLRRQAKQRAAGGVGNVPRAAPQQKAQEMSEYQSARFDKVCTAAVGRFAKRIGARQWRIHARRHIWPRLAALSLAQRDLCGCHFYSQSGVNRTREDRGLVNTLCATAFVVAICNVLKKKPSL
jgi:hypothetical protein